MKLSLFLFFYMERVVRTAGLDRLENFFFLGVFFLPVKTETNISLLAFLLSDVATIKSIIIIFSRLNITSTIIIISTTNRSDVFTEVVILKVFITCILKKMENDILLATKHIKEVSKKKVTFVKIEQFIKRNKIEISTEELQRIIENV